MIQTTKERYLPILIIIVSLISQLSAWVFYTKFTFVTQNSSNILLLALILFFNVVVCGYGIAFIYNQYLFKKSEDN